MHSLYEMKKYCIYFCVFYNAKYIELLKLCLTSLKKSCSFTDIDILVLTDDAFLPVINEFNATLNLPLKCITKPFAHTIFAAASARVHIFDTEFAEAIATYEKLLYLDTDILVKKDLTPLFTTAFALDKICALEEGTIESDNFGAEFFEKDKKEDIDWTLSGLNSGILLFYNNPNNALLFKEIRENMESFAEKEEDIPVCLDQPFINYAVIKANKFERGILEKWAGLFDFDGTPVNHRELAICHFSWPIGNFESKYKRMRNYFDFIFPMCDT